MMISHLITFWDLSNIQFVIQLVCYTLIVLVFNQYAQQYYVKPKSFILT